jgi:hypothetical protein
MNRLVLRYRYDDSHFHPALDRDDFGRLTVSVETETQAGTGGFWVQWQDIVEFAGSLSEYPIAIENPISAQWGYESLEGDDLIIGIVIGPKDALGELTASIEVADDHEQWHRVRTSFRTGYPALEMFKRDIERLMKSEIEEAVLQGH